MSHPIFTLEALDARHGDCLLLHYGHSGAPRIITIDGGPKGVYAERLGPRLEAIRAARGLGSLEIRLLMVSHIDDDHIGGVLDLTAELRRLQDASQPLPYDILTLWHNSFDDLVKRLGADAQYVLRTRMLESELPQSKAIGASVPQGRQLRLDADALSFNVNPGFGALVSFSKGAPSLDMGQGLSLTVLGPRRTQLEALQRQWQAAVEKLVRKSKGKKPAGLSRTAPTVDELKVVATAFVDRSIPNLSSIVVLAQSAGRSILLTGDARGDLIVKSLQEARLLEDGKISVDVLKVPHHGSERDVAPSFFKTVLADHYVFSASGKYGNPDVETFRMLFGARPKGGYTIWLTNDVPASVKFIEKNKPPGAILKIRPEQAPSVKIELGEPIGV